MPGNLPHTEGVRPLPVLRKQLEKCLVILFCALTVMVLSDGIAQAQSSVLHNGDFERDPLTGWELNTYGAAPHVLSDIHTYHRGRGSVEISSSEPSDTALAQELQLKPGAPYQLKGWVRTRGLNPQGAPVFGTFQVQREHGTGTIVSGRNHAGDTDWTEESVSFVAPRSGRVRICIFFVGFGRGVGTAWFDGVEVKPLDLADKPVTITLDPLSEGTISPYQYGQFIEYLCDLVPGMWAEKLYDGSFEGLTPYKFAYLRETDFKEKPWTHSGSPNRAVYALDSSTRVAGAVSQRIEVGAPYEGSIEQSGIAVERDKRLHFSCWMRVRDSSAGSVKVSLQNSSQTLAELDFHPGPEWQKVSGTLTPSETDVNARLTITLRGPGTLWLDNSSLMPEDSVGGWRPDVVAAVRALKPGIIRFGGSALDDSNLGDFRWSTTIGDPDKRQPFRAWGGLQPVGPGLEEIVQFCHAVGAEPLICVRFTGSTPAEAAEQVQYFNGSPDTPMGSLRARNGHREPYRIRYWQVGNERSGSSYESGLAAFCRAMRAVDPSIRLLSSYPTPGVLHAAGELIDYVSPHQYDCADLSGCANELNAVRSMITESAPGRKIRVGVTEWNTTAGDWGPGRAKLWTLANALACSRYHNLLHRNCDLVEIANRSNLTNSFCSGIIQTDNHRLYKTPTYYAQQLYSTLAGERPLALKSKVAPSFGPDLSATLSKDSSTLTLFAVNESSTGVTRKIDLTAVHGLNRTAEVWTLGDRDRSGDPDITNGFDYPTRIAPIQSALTPDRPIFRYEFPPYSLTVLRWKIKAGRR